MENKRDLLVTLADKNYILQAKQLFSSVYWNAGWEGDYMLLSHEIPEEEIKWFSDKGILIKECKTLYNGKMGDGIYSMSVLDKFYLFTEEFKKWGKVVFLDADIIVRASLDKLRNTKSFSSPITCKSNFRVFFRSGESKELSILAEECDLSRPAFNSGVFSFDTSIIKEDTFEKLLTILKKYAAICPADDCILNLLFYDQWIPVPIVYNTRENQVFFKKIDGIVLHFERPYNKKNYKPWNEENPFYQEWKSNLEKAESIDLKKIQKGKQWNNYKIKYYSFLLNICIYVNMISDVLTPVFRKFKDFFVYKLKYSLIYFMGTPNRSIGKIGEFIKKNNPDLYYKLKKVIGGK